MTRHCVTDEEYGRLCRRLDEVKRRVAEGTIPFQGTMNGLQVIIETSKFTVWKTIKLGTGIKDAGGFRKALEDSGMEIHDWITDDMLKRPAFTVSSRETEIDLVVVSAAKLGFETSAQREQIYDCARLFGLKICPPEVGPQLRLQYKDQPKKEKLLIAMEPISAGGYPEVFCVSHDFGLYLSSEISWPERDWNADRHWVFVLPRKSRS